jgi:hypothetical protein
MICPTSIQEEGSLLEDQAPKHNSVAEIMEQQAEGIIKERRQEIVQGKIHAQR